MNFRQYFSLVDMQARMALQSEASRYYFGYFWWILEPLLFVAVFYLVFSVFLKTRQEDFLVFLMCGKLPFIWFSKSVSQASGSIMANAGLIGRIDIPKTMFPMAIIQEGLYKQSMVFLLLFGVLFVYGYTPSLLWLWLIPIMAVYYLMIVACSFAGAFLVCFMRDFTMFISLGMMFLMFTSGIFWDVREIGSPAMTDAILTYNPMAFILDAFRQVLMYNVTPNLLGLSLNVVAFGLLLACMIFLIRKNSQLLALKSLTA
ncbi:ABC-2 type transporter superfamily protein [marine gamma proteobacterium HTCC2148]|nr:ABC-2 type transporter superfamily protein [marine gamma proteobacterium HTCC2148]